MVGADGLLVLCAAKLSQVANKLLGLLVDACLLRQLFHDELLDRRSY